MIHHNTLLGIAGLAIGLLCSPGTLHACAQVHGTSLDGLPSASSSFSAYRIQLEIKANPAGRMSGILNSQTTNAREEKENGAVALMFSGNPNEAARILLEMEKESPGEYTIAANLGTAYELSGDVPNALVWIKEGIRRNPDSHRGTEWLHQLILETKIHLQSDPNYLATHRIIPLPKNFTKSTMVDVGGKERAVEAIKQTLYYQLLERCVFVKPPDPIVADLLFSYARIEAHTSTVEMGLELLGMAKEYGFADPPSLDQAEARYKASIRLSGIYLTLALVLAVAALYVAYRKKWFFLTHAAYRRHLAEKAGRTNVPSGSSRTNLEEAAPKPAGDATR